MKLTGSEINEKLKELSGWRFKDNSISKIFEFKDFLESIEFVNKVAPIAEELNHHPDIDIRYSKVIISLSTHDEKGVTEKDIQLAKRTGKL